MPKPWTQSEMSVFRHFANPEVVPMNSQMFRDLVEASTQPPSRVVDPHVPPPLHAPPSTPPPMDPDLEERRRRRLLYDWKGLARNHTSSRRPEEMSNKELETDIEDWSVLRHLRDNVVIIRFVLVLIIRLLEGLSVHFKVLHLDGWSREVKQNLTQEQELLETLARKYFHTGSFPPEVMLMLVLAGSAWDVHHRNSQGRSTSQPMPFQNTLFSSPGPSSEPSQGGIFSACRGMMQGLGSQMMGGGGLGGMMNGLMEGGGGLGGMMMGMMGGGGLPPQPLPEQRSFAESMRTLTRVLPVEEKKEEEDVPEEVPEEEKEEKNEEEEENEEEKETQKEDDVIELERPARPPMRSVAGPLAFISTIDAL